MAQPDASNERQLSEDTTGDSAAAGSNRRLVLLVGLLALALFALWYDYKVARPAVEQAYERINVKNSEINSAAEHRVMTSADVQSALRRQPSDTFLNGNYTIEAYRWRAGMPLELRGLSGDQSPGIGLKTHDYFAVYRKDGPRLNFVTHFKFDLDHDYFVEKVAIRSSDSGVDEVGMPDMAMMSGMGGAGGPGGGGDFDPEAFFAERDADGDGVLAGEEISERMRGRLEAIDTDGDGAVSKDEFLAGRREASGPGARDASAAASDRRQRPPLEDDANAPPAEAAPTSDVEPAAASSDAADEAAADASAAATTGDEDSAGEPS